MINDSLDVSKADAGALTLDPWPFKLSRMENEPARLVARLAQLKGLALAVRVELGLTAHVAGDPDRFQQVVVNLVGNAMEVTEAGGCTSPDRERFGPRQRAAPFAGRGRGHRPRCAGRPRRRRVQPLHPDRRHLDAPARRHGVWALPSKDLVEAMDGRISVKSAPGHGSVFRFEVELPVAEGEPAAVGAPVYVPSGRFLAPFPRIDITAETIVGPLSVICRGEAGASGTPGKNGKVEGQAHLRLRDQEVRRLRGDPRHERRSGRSRRPRLPRRPDRRAPRCLLAYNRRCGARCLRPPEAPPPGEPHRPRASRGTNRGCDGSARWRPGRERGPRRRRLPG